ASRGSPCVWSSIVVFCLAAVHCAPSSPPARIHPSPTDTQAPHRGAPPRPGLRGPTSQPMDIRADEISRILKEQIKDYGQKVSVAETGSVLSVGDGIARIYGLQYVVSGELVEFSSGQQGLVLNLEEDNVGVAILGDFQSIREGDTVKRTGQIASVPVGKELLGRVVNALGQPIDGKGPINTTETRRLEVKAP